MAQYWFKPRDYGYGATPATWEGWALSFGTGAIIGALTFVLVSSGRSDAAVVVPYLLAVASVTGVLLLVARRKTDGAWRWRWGREQN
jgi:branched-subunit amino acid transport protein